MCQALNLTEFGSSHQRWSTPTSRFDCVSQELEVCSSHSISLSSTRQQNCGCPRLNQRMSRSIAELGDGQLSAPRKRLRSLPSLGAITFYDRVVDATRTAFRACDVGRPRSSRSIRAKVAASIASSGPPTMSPR